MLNNRFIPQIIIGIIGMSVMFVVVVEVVDFTDQNNIAGGIEGTYISETGSILELRENNRFTVTQVYSFAGDYTYDTDIVVLIHPYGSFIFNRNGKNLIDPEGEFWYKN